MIFQNYHPVDVSLDFCFSHEILWLKTRTSKRLTKITTQLATVMCHPLISERHRRPFLCCSWGKMLVLPPQCLLCFIKKKKNKVSLNQELSCFLMSRLILTCQSWRIKNPEEPSGMVVKVRISVSAGDVLKEDGMAILLVHIIHPFYLELAVASQGKAFWGSDSGTSSRSDPLGTSLKREHTLFSLPGRLFAPTPCKDERCVGFCALVSAAVRGQSSRRSRSQQMSLRLFLSPSSFHWLLSM